MQAIAVLSLVAVNALAASIPAVRELEMSSGAVVLPISQHASSSNLKAHMRRHLNRYHGKKHCHHGHCPDYDVGDRISAVSLRSEYGDREYLVDVMLGTPHQAFKLAVDVGSPYTWVPRMGFSCVNFDNGAMPPHACNFGSEGFNPTKSSTWSPSSDASMSGHFADHTFYTGTTGSETISVGGLTAPHQPISFFEQMYFEGDGYSSGVLGLAYPGLAQSAKPTTKAERDEHSHHGHEHTELELDGPQAPMNPFFSSVMETNAIPPYYSLALNRLSSSDLGYISFGGLPPVATTQTSVSLPITSIHTGTETSNYTFYSVPVDSYVFDSTSAVTATTAILDPGAAWIVLNSATAQAYNAQFKPGGVQFGQFFLVDCHVSAPLLSVTLSGQSFEIDPQDLVVPFSEGKCASAVVDGGKETQFLGDPFLRNVVLSFNVLDGTVLVTQREKY